MKLKVVSEQKTVYKIVDEDGKSQSYEAFDNKQAATHVARRLFMANHIVKTDRTTWPDNFTVGSMADFIASNWDNLLIALNTEIEVEGEPSYTIIENRKIEA